MKKMLLWGVVLNLSVWACQENPIERGASFFERALQMAKNSQVGLDMSQIGIKEADGTIDEVYFDEAVRDQLPAERVNAFKKFCRFMAGRVSRAQQPKIPVTTRQLAYDFAALENIAASDFFDRYDILTEIAMFIASLNHVESSHIDMTEINKRAGEYKENEAR